MLLFSKTDVRCRLTSKACGRDWWRLRPDLSQQRDLFSSNESLEADDSFKSAIAFDNGTYSLRLSPGGAPRKEKTHSTSFPDASNKRRHRVWSNLCFLAPSSCSALRSADRLPADGDGSALMAANLFFANMQRWANRTQRRTSPPRRFAAEWEPQHKL